MENTKSVLIPEEVPVSSITNLYPLIRSGLVCSGHGGNGGGNGGNNSRLLAIAFGTTVLLKCIFRKRTSS